MPTRLQAILFSHGRYLATQRIVFALTLVMTTTLVVSAQESIRTVELSGLRTFRPPSETNLINFGPFHGLATLGVGYDYNDDANISGSLPTATKLTRNQIFESLGLSLAWLITPLNRVDLQGGIKLDEDFYSNGRTNVEVEISPGTELRLQALIGDVKVQAFEQFSIAQDSASDPTVTNQTNLNRLTNTVGVICSVPVFSAELSGGADYTYSEALSSSNTGSSNTGSSSNTGVSQTRNTFRLSGAATFFWNPSIQYGADVFLNHSWGAILSDVNTISFGPFLRGHLTRLIELDLSGGLTLPESGNLPSPGYYLAALLRHQINRDVQLIASVSHDLQYSSGLELDEVTSVIGGVEYRLSRSARVAGTLFLNVGHVVSGITPGNFTQYGGQISADVPIYKRVYATLSYRYVGREGAGSTTGGGGSYSQNEISLGVFYAF
jgi:hypothetical protein